MSRPVQKLSGGLQAPGTALARPGSPRWLLTARQQCDLELIATGGFSPITTFLGEADYESVCERMRLADGTLWPVPVVLDVSEALLLALDESGKVLLTDEQGAVLAVLRITEAWRPDRCDEARAVFGTTDPTHPGVAYLLQDTREWYVAGELEIRRLPSHAELPAMLHTPAEVKAEFRRRGWTEVVAFNSRNPMHEAHRALVLRAARELNAAILLHPVVGPTRRGDLPVPVRVRCYEAVMRTLPPGMAMLSLMPLAMRMAGPREALWHAILRRNYGATAFIVGRDHAGPGEDASGRPFYASDEAQRLVEGHQAELKIRIVTAPELVHVEGRGYLTREQAGSASRARSISGTRIRQLLSAGADIPPWLMLPEVAQALSEGAPVPAPVREAATSGDARAFSRTGRAASRG